MSSYESEGRTSKAVSSTPPTSHNSPSTHNQPPYIPHRNAISQQRLWEVVLKNMSLHCGVHSVDLFCGKGGGTTFIRIFMFFSPAICYRRYLMMKNDLYCPLWTAFWPRNAFGWFIKKNIAKGTTDPRVQFILQK